MASLNKVFLIGNLTKDPELRYTQSGRPVCDLRLAVSRRFKKASGEDGEETLYITVVIWDKQGEACGKYLAKGAPAFVEGRLQMDEWEKDGRKTSTLRVLADRVQFLGVPKRADAEDGGGPAIRRPAAPVAPAQAAPGGDEPPAATASEGAPDDENLPF
jgi:single-strand DNA-binding protein